jgi:hypothetical protein
LISVPKLGAIVTIISTTPEANKILSTLSGKTQSTIFFLNLAAIGGKMNYSYSQVMGDGR